MSFDITSKPPVKGMLTNMRTGENLTFGINPSEIDYEHSANVSEDAIPGFSDPLLRFASGKTKVIKFKLQLSGEMRLRYGVQQFPNGADGSTGGTNYSIKGELDFLEAACSPTDPAAGGDGGLDRFAFTFGSKFPSVAVFVCDAPSKLKRFDSQLNPTEADVNLVLKRVQDQSVYASRIWSQG